MKHPGVSTILATGGNGMVRAAYSSGKPALGVGAGNVPAYVHRGARLRRAVHDIVLSKSFDNGMICASEQAVIIDAEVYPAALAEFQRLHAHVATRDEKRRIEELIFGGAPVATTALAGDWARLAIANDNRYLLMVGDPLNIGSARWDMCWWSRAGSVR